MATRKFSRLEINTWYQSLTSEHRELIKDEAMRLVKQWVSVNNEQGLLPAFTFWKKATHFNIPIQRAWFDKCLALATNAMSFSL